MLSIKKYYLIFVYQAINDMPYLRIGNLIHKRKYNILWYQKELYNSVLKKPSFEVMQQFYRDFKIYHKHLYLHH